MKNTLTITAAVILFCSLESMTAANFSLLSQSKANKDSREMPPMRLVFGSRSDEGARTFLTKIGPSSITPLLELPYKFLEGEFSFDGSALAYCNCGDWSSKTYGVYVTHLARRETRLVTPLATKYCPLVQWSSDGKYLSYNDDDSQLHLINLATCEDRVWPNIQGAFRHSWNPKGNQIVFERGHGSVRELFIADLNGNVRQLTSLKGFNDYETAFPVWSRDGSQIAFIVMEVDREKARKAWLDTQPGDEHFFFRAGGKAVLHLIAPDGTGVKRLTPSVNAYICGWSEDSEWIIFSSDNRRLMRVRKDGSDLGIISESAGYESFISFSLAPLR
jgi:Tol biopolymer transport system component